MSERIILKGRTEFLKPIITQVLAVHQLLENRDIGEFVGYPLEEFVRAKPQSLNLKILFYSVQTPPWRAEAGKRLVRATYAIPNVDKAAIEWTRIKIACGGDNGYLWGRWRATANLDDGRQMQVHGGSEGEAEERLKALQALSNSEILTLSVTEEKKEGRRAADKGLYKETTRIYPAYFTIIHQEKIVKETNHNFLSGNYKKHKARIPLWVNSKPSNADALVREALRVKGG